MGIAEFIQRWREKRLTNQEKFQEAMQEHKIQKKILELEKSANERELERFMKENREKNIKKELEQFRKAKLDEYLHGHKILKVKNMFANGKNEIIRNDLKMFKNEIKGGDIYFK